MKAGQRLTRRAFLARTAAAGAAFQILPPRLVFGGPDAPSNMITRGVIGTGGMGMGHVTEYPQTLAVCDVDANHLARAAQKAGGKVTPYRDWREMLERDDIDTIHIPTPPHWHALIAIASAQAGKDVYSEKPATHTIAEGKALAECMARYGAVYQVNTYGRGSMRFARKAVASGILGAPVMVYMNPANGYNFKIREWSGRTNLPVVPIPPELDYDMWLGPAPVKPYHPHRVHGSFRGYWDYDEGGLGDMGQHHIDPIQYALGKDDTSPVEIEAIAPPQHDDACGLWQTVHLKYADGAGITLESWEWGEKTTEGKPLIEGPNGKLWGGNRLEPPGLAAELAKYPEPPPLCSFEEAVRSRRNEHSAHPNPRQAARSADLLHLAAMAIRLGRKLYYDPGKREFINDAAANRMAYPPMRAPWRLPLS